MTSKGKEYIQLHQSASYTDLSADEDAEDESAFLAEKQQQQQPQHTQRAPRNRTPLILGLAGLVLVVLLSLSRLGSTHSEAQSELSSGAAPSAAQEQQQQQTKQQQPENPQEPPTKELDSTPPPLDGRYLLAGYVTEQETKAMYHLYDLCLLARSLNRTFVLPQVESARFGYCRSRPFDLFYEPDAISSFGCSTMTHEAYLEARASHAKRPTAQIVRFQHNSVDRPDAGVGVRYGSKSTEDGGFFEFRAPCLRTDEFDFTDRAPLRVGRNPRVRGADGDVAAFGTSVVKSLREWDDLAPGGTAVLIVSVLYQKPFMTDRVALSLAPDFGPALPFKYLDYSHIWTAYADKIANHLGPYIAVHWRSEGVGRQPGVLSGCAKGLIDTLVTLHAKHPTIKNVYILMDYPLYSINKDGSPKQLNPGQHAVGNSDTFGEMNPEIDLAMQDFVRQLATRAPRLNWHTMRAMEDQLGVPDMAQKLLATMTDKHVGVPSGLDQIDRTLVGITDKLVAARAELFISSGWSDPSTACGRVSSFTRNIASLRQDRFDKQRKTHARDPPGQLWNVDYKFWRKPSRGKHGRGL